MRNKNRYLPIRLFILAVFFLHSVAFAQQVVVMPHRSTDTLTIDRQHCYTILDPGGYSNYSNDENSWLYINSTSGDFILQLNYQTGASNDCSDYLDIYSAADSNTVYTRFCDIGSDSWHSSTSGTLIHFRSNAYASFQGFEMKILFPNSIYNWNYQPVNDSTVTLTWDDQLEESTQWTVTYYCDVDSMMTITTNTKSVTITGLRNNTYYGYYIENNAVACMETSLQYFMAGHPGNMLYTEPHGSSFTLASGTCYTLNAPSGPGSNSLPTDWINTTLSTPDHVGFYADGWSANNYFGTSWNTGYGFGSDISLWDANTQRRRQLYFPLGEGTLSHTGNTKFLYRITWENNLIVRPTVSSLAATAATIQWSDTSASTLWTVRYAPTEGGWTTRTVSTPSVTLTGLEPGTQYIYTIEGNSPLPCVTPFRHAFVTPGLSDTLIMPYRNTDTVVLQPGQCYTVVDAGGGTHNYFHSDYSAYTLHTANGKGFRLKGWYNITSPDRLYIFCNNEWHSFDGDNSNLDLYCADGTCTIGFTSDPTGNGLGFAFSIIQLDTAITNLQASNVTATNATIAWTDPSSADGWKIHYGNAEDNFVTLPTSTPSATLTGLLPGTQYVYYVTRQGAGSPCQFPDRHAFITQGVDSNTVILPYRGSDTLYYTPGQCYTILDAGGRNHSYFNLDTSQLVIISTNGDDFFLTGQFEYPDYADFESNSYDPDDRLWTSTNRTASDVFDNEFNGGWNWYNGNRIRVQSQDGFLRLRWCTNHQTFRHGFTLRLDSDTSTISDIQVTHVNHTSADIAWTDHSGYTGPWHIAYSADDSLWTSTLSATDHTTLNGLLPSTRYTFRISRNPIGQDCGLQSYTFATLNTNDIVMRSHSRDTVWLTPGECYTVYDPGGVGDYFSADTSTLVLRSTTGLGFRLVGYAEVSDLLSFESDGSNSSPYWWTVDNYYPDGTAHITLTTNEALNSPGFAFRIYFYPTLHSLDTLWQTDTSIAITWQDTTAANHWTITYGTHIDSLRTITAATNQAILTGLHRNAQCYLQIESNFSASPCVIPSIYGIRTRHDPDFWVTQYHNTLLENISRHSLVENPVDIIPSTECIHIYDVGGLNPPFPDCTMDHDFSTADGRGFTLNGHYNLGSSSLHIHTVATTSDYSGIGNTHVYSPDGYLCLIFQSSSDPHGNGEGFDLELLMSYAIHQITASHPSCSTATLTWTDTSDATRWWIAYGPDERSLDTLSTSTRSCTLNALNPDCQYVCYLWSNETIISCHAPVKHAFTTPCDTTLIIMPLNADTSRTLDINSCYTVLDPGGHHDYHYNSNQTIHLHSSSGDPITLRGNAHIHPDDQLTIYDEGSWQWYIVNWSGDDDHFEIHSSTGHLCIQFNSNGDTLTNSGFQFQVLFNTIGNIQADLMTDSTCRIRWDDNSTATRWTFWYGPDRDHMDSLSSDSRTVHLSGLTPGTLYSAFITNNAVECIDTTWYEFCAGGDNCIDFTNLYSCHTRCRYGDVNDPDANQGTIDFGPDNIYSRHTVMTDTSFRDPRTGNQLRSIPWGHDLSVRLGNWNIGGEAESITYEYIVDTANADILLLRYAAVLENPDHQPDEQPRFQFTITDQNDIPISPECYSADFVPSDSLQWNTYHYDTSTVLWKDWTSVGIDLSPFHGRRIFVKLTTRDCSQSGHFGYAYFTLSCDQKYIRTGACGHVTANTFTAPEGFRYRWYNVDSTGVTLDTTQTFTSSQPGTYRCHASFAGNTNANCFFEKTVVVGNIFPHADFTYQFVDTIDCRVQVRFLNLSRVATDSFQTSDMECDSFIWDFGDGDSSRLRHPTHIFQPGYADVRLTALLGQDSCSHDTLIRIPIPSPCIHYDTLRSAICHGDTFRLAGSTFTETGAYTIRQTFAPDSITETLLLLTVHPSYHLHITDNLCSNQPYNRYGITLPAGIQPDTILYFESPYRTVHQCDSIYHLTLRTNPYYNTHAEAQACSDRGYILANDTVYQSGQYIDSLHTQAGCDSTVHLNLTVHPAYHTYTADTLCDGAAYRFHDTLLTSTGNYTVTYRTLQGCDSSFHIALALHPRFDHYDTILLCRRQPYYFHGIPHYAPAHLADTFQTIHGCDSLYHTILLPNDSAARAGWLISDDTIHWIPVADTLWQGCSPYTLYFRNTSLHASASTWQLDDSTTRNQGSGPYDHTPFFAHTYTTGHYRFQLSVADILGCTDTLFNHSGVRVIPSPKADFFWDTLQPSQLHPWTAFHNTSIPLDSTCSFLWLFEKQPLNPDDLDSTRLINPAYRWDTTGVQLPASYQVWLILTQYNINPDGDTLFCTDTVTDTVRITPSTLQFPSVVTPNGDGYNDRFRIGNLIEYHRYPYNKLTIYDRWGHLVYQVDNISLDDHFWDPESTSTPDGTYYYRFVGSGNDGSVQRNGVIEILRKP